MASARFPGAAAASRPGDDDPESVVLTTRVLVAGDDEVIPDWKEKRIAVLVPLNLSVKTFLERTLQGKLGWDDMHDVTPFVGQGTDLNQIRATKEVLQIMLTPRQLGWEADSVHWVWLKWSDGNTELLTAKEVYRERVSRFYEYYEPQSLHKIDELMASFEGTEEFLLLQLGAKYGKEPSKEDVILRKRQRRGGAALPVAQGPSPPATGEPVPPQATTVLPPGPEQPQRATFATASTEIKNVAALITRGSESLLTLAYFRKWTEFQRHRRDARRVCSYLSGRMDLFIQREYYKKLKYHYETKKMRRQLLATTQLAFKTESLAGDLVTENSQLKEQVKHLKGSLEILENTNARRLENLFSSSESAVAQIKALTRETQEKDAIINRLEAKLMTIGNQMLSHVEEKEKVSQASEAARFKLEEELDLVRNKLHEVENLFYESQEQIKKLEAKSQTQGCERCKEYTNLTHELELHQLNGDKLRKMIEAAEADKRALNETLSKVMKEKADLLAEVEQLRSMVTGGGGAAPLGAADRQQSSTMLPKQLSHSLASFSDQQPSCNPSFNITAPQAAQLQNPNYAPSNNPSFAFAQPGNASFANNPLGASMAANPSFTSAVTAARTAKPNSMTTPPDAALPESVPRGGERAKMSLESFFEREERLAADRMKLAMDRQAAVHTTTFRGSQALATGKYSTGSRAPEAGVSLVQRAMAAEASRIGPPKAASLMVSSQLSNRPVTAPRHTTFDVGAEVGTAEQRRAHLFGF